MSRDQRVNDNWALIYAQELALKKKAPLFVVFTLDENFPQANLRHFDFLFQGLKSVESELQKKAIPFYLLKGSPLKTLPTFSKEHQIAEIITDFSPLSIKKEWIKSISSKISCSMTEVDAHNIVPCRVASPKKEFGAYTIRPKINRLLADFLTDFPKIKKHPYINSKKAPTISWDKELADLQIDKTVPPVKFPVPSEKEALRQLRKFLKLGLTHYALKKNIPYMPYTSRLSPYLHFGQISAQRVALEVEKLFTNKRKSSSALSFLEELIVRRELSDNFCFYSDDYKSCTNFPNWSQVTLKAHAKDKRNYLYKLKEFENAQTHDELWNAAQNEMRRFGYMHGYMRMYWAKKILEWTRSPEEAMNFAIYLNDKYMLDGRDPNGYTGIAWSIGGVHDRAWGERPIFGKIRYMALSGCKNKFDIQAYIKMVNAPEL